MKTLRDEIAKRFSGWVQRAKRGSRQAQIWLNCVECMGGDVHKARSCAHKACFLWPSGLAARQARETAKKGPEVIRGCDLETRHADEGGRQ